jgi:hypothetical protein
MFSPRQCDAGRSGDPSAGRSVPTERRDAHVFGQNTFGRQACLPGLPRKDLWGKTTKGSRSL